MCIKPHFHTEHVYLQSPFTIQLITSLFVSITYTKLAIWNQKGKQHPKKEQSVSSAFLYLMYRHSPVSSASASVCAAQYASTNDEQRSRGPANVYGCPEFPSPLRGQRVVKTCDDAVSRQADRNNTQDPCYNKHHTSCQANVGFGQTVIIAEVGAASSYHRQSDGHYADPDGDADQSSGGL